MCSAGAAYLSLFLPATHIMKCKFNYICDVKCLDLLPKKKKKSLKYVGKCKQSHSQAALKKHYSTRTCRVFFVGGW